MAYIVIGLGNPGSEYAKTRHNAGRMVVETLAKLHDFPEFTLKKNAQALVSEGMIEGEKVQLVIPDVYMNHSGKSALPVVKSKAQAKKLLVIRDELDLPLGVIKMTTYGRGSGGHKGIESIMRALKTKDFIQMKVGISGATTKGKVRKPKGEDGVVKHVIGKFKPAEELLLKKTLKKAASAAALFAQGSLERAMLEANTK